MSLKHNFNEPSCKRSRVDSYPLKQSFINNNGSVSSKMSDPFDDCFTGDELLELELLATQAETGAKQDNLIVKKPQDFLPQRTHLTTSKNSSIIPEEIERLKKLVDEKSGESRLLRDKVCSLENLLHSERQAKLLEEQRHKDERSQREIDLTKSLDSYKDRLEFKEAELQEAFSIIKNLESKNKDVLKNFKKVQIKTFPFEHNDLSPTKLRTIKPSSPQVVVKKKTSKAPQAPTPHPNLLTGGESVVQPHPQRDPPHTPRGPHHTSNPIRCSVRNIPPPQHAYFYRVCTFFTQLDRSCSVGIFSAIQRLLNSNNRVPEESMLDDALIVLRPVICALRSSAVNGGCSPPKCRGTPCHCQDLEDVASRDNSWIVDDFFQVLVILFRIHSGITNILEDVVSTASMYLDRPAYHCRAMELLTVTSTFCFAQHSSIFLPIIEKLDVSRDLNCSASVFEFLISCTLNCDATERLVRRDSDGVPFFVRLCLAAVEGNTRPGSNRTTLLSKIVRFLTSFISHCDVVLNKERCGPELFRLVCIIIHQLFAHPQGDKLTLNYAYCFYICLTTLGFEPVVMPDRRNLFVFYKLKDFLGKQMKCVWVEELMRILQQEAGIDS